MSDKRLLWNVYRVLFIFIIDLVLVGLLPQAALAATVPKSGTITIDETWTADNVYVVSGTLVVDKTATVTMEAGVVVKFEYQAGMRVDGRLLLQGASGSPVVFTSIKDDYYGGDTNQDGSATLPAPQDWGYLELANSLTTFQYAVLRYADLGLRIYNSSTNPISPPILNNILEYNQTGIKLEAANGDITSVIQNNHILLNGYGLVADGAFTGYNTISLVGNRFEKNSIYPLFLLGNSYPNYIDNTFINNAHPAVAVGETITLSGDWPIVYDAPGSSTALPYVIPDYLGVEDGATLFLPAGLIIKFESNGLMSVYGSLDLAGTAGNPVTFTSIHDDIGGDTDGVAISPARGDWAGIDIYNNASGLTTIFDYANLRYATSGLSLLNSGINNFAVEVAYSRFEDSEYGLILWSTNSGDVTSSVHDNTISDNTIGILNKSGTTNTGAAHPAISNNLFQNHSGYPLVLENNAFPTYSGNLFQNNLHAAVAASGVLNRSVNWENVNGIPYVINNSLTVRPGQSLSLPAGLVVKFDAGRSMTVYGNLVLGSVPGSPIVFTSIHDDAYSGDTDGAPIAPAMGAWSQIKFQDSPSPFFNDVIVRYATTGVYLYNSTAGQINFQINRAVFQFNQTGLSLEAHASGNLVGSVLDSQLSQNGTGIRLVQSPTSSLSQLTVSNSNLVGNGAWAIFNPQTGADVLAAGNWWGSATGPWNQLTNPGGWGDAVSDHVVFDPWLAAPVGTPLSQRSINLLPLACRK